MDELPANRETLRQAILEADLLLAYAASHGVKVDDGTVTTIVQSKQLLDENTLEKNTFEQQIAFWKARGVLAQAVHPISANSLKQCTLPGPESSWLPQWLLKVLGWERRYATGVEKIIRKMQVRIFVPVAVLLIIQVYTLIGAAVVGDLIPRMDKMQTYLAEVERLENADNTDANLHAHKLAENQVALTRVEIEIRVQMLSKWNKGWSWIATPFQTGSPDPHTGAVEPGNRDTKYFLFRAMVLQAQFALQVLQNFILPLFYGCLGASLFVLRALAMDAKENTFDMERQIGYNLRIYMGTLCGLVIAWFIPDAPVQESGLTQYSLSVLGGYSVDIVFGLMDKVINSFSGAGAGKSAK